MSFLEYVVAYVVILGVLVVVHEWGHFIMARICGIRVDEFSIGFGPRAVRIGKRGDTEYNIRWVPLGGFVKIAGMEPDEEPLIRAAEKVRGLGGKDDSQASAIDSGKAFSEIPLVAENIPNIAETSEQRLRDETEGFYAHPIWQRALVIFAGPFMSFALGYIIFLALALFVGVAGPALNRVDQVNPASEAQRMGLRAGDTITGINGIKVKDGDQLVGIIHKSIGKPVQLVVVHSDGRTVEMTGTPQKTVENGETFGVLGFVPAFKMEHVSPVDGFRIANHTTLFWLQMVGSLFERHNFNEIRQSLGGPIRIAQVTKQSVDQGGESTYMLMAQLSMSLALFNLLPIPILDGGHLLMFFIEALRRGRRLTIEQQQNFMLTGLAVIGVLFLLIMCNDIMRNIHPIH